MATDNGIPMRLDVRIPQAMHDFLEEQSRLKRLSFEGLILAYIEEQMQRERKDRDETDRDRTDRERDR